MSASNMVWGGGVVGLTTLPLSCANYLKIWGVSTSRNSQGLYRDCFTFTFTFSTIK